MVDFDWAKMAILEATKHPIEVPFQSVVQFNPTICVDDKGALRVVLRVKSKTGAWTMNFAARVSPDWKLVGPARQIPAFSGHVNLEDLRLFFHQGKMCAVASSWVQDRPDIGLRQVLLEFSTDGWRIKSARPQRQIAKCENNWMPCVLPAGELKWVRGIEPLNILSVADAAEGDTVSVAAPTGLNGSSQLVAWRGGWLAVAHRDLQEASKDFNPLMGSWGPMVRYCPSYFCRFDANLMRVEVSRPFFFHKPGIELCCGLAPWGDGLVAAYGVEDKTAWLAEIKAETVDAQFD
jgi:hypothetical protein